ncbi:MAG TPA: hypothetical protein VIE65_07310 [Methylobacter sp.]|jgi:hypothetical protein
MKAIIISDADARALLDKLELTAMKGANHFREDYDRPANASEMHRAFHYVVCKWLQEQGADVLPR